MIADAKTLEALREALDDEYRARAIYRKVVETFGPVRPFVNIAEAEDRHTRALLTLFERFGVDPPQDTWPARVTAPRSMLEACRDAVAAEIENEAMYERLISQISDPGALAVMRRLQRASQERHLPAFQRCVERETAGRRGSGGPDLTRPLPRRLRQRGRRASPSD
jgi:rubrerythrin